MLKRYHRFVGGLFRVSDAVLVGAVWLLSYWLRFTLPLVPITKGFPEFSTYSALTPLVVVLWVLIFSAMGVYQSTRMLRRTHEAHAVIRAHGTALLVFITLTYLFSEYKYSRGVVVYFGILSGILLVASRLVVRNTLREVRRRGYQQQKVLVVGDGSAARGVIYRVNRFPELGMRVVGVLMSETAQESTFEKQPVLGTYAQMVAVLKQHSVDLVVIALPRRQSMQADTLLELLKDETVDIQLIPDVFEYVTLGCEIEDFDGIPVVRLNDSPLEGWGFVAKRTTDVLVAGIALLLLSPVFLLLALLVKLTSRGPVFFEQERMGMDGRLFRMIKFRTMIADAEKQTGPVWASSEDARRTPIGTFLRSTSLDEIPQFWNVFKGEMSLVGPRPERPIFVEKFRTEVPHYMLRHKVKAGITGWAQINGWRGNTSLDQRIECDLYYIRNWSYWMDWKIMFMTLWKGFINKNAY